MLNKFRIFVFIALACSQIYCGNSDYSSNSGPDTGDEYSFDAPADSDKDIETVDESGFVAGGDITNALASNKSGDCETYVNNYTSSVIDLTTGKSFSGTVDISFNGDKCAVSSNGIPNHNMGEGGFFPNAISEVNQSYEFTSSPQIILEPIKNIWKVSVVLLNGGVVDILPAACYGVGNSLLGREKVGCGSNYIDHPWRYDPMSSLNDFGTDIHNAHVQPNGLYHYHANPMAIFDGDCNNQSTASPVIGFAADGFPVFGSCILDQQTGLVREVLSSYKLKDGGGSRKNVNGYQTPIAGNGNIASSNYDGQFRGDYEFVENSGDLDQCNGMAVDGQYGYYVTNSFPWVLNCFSGTPDDSF